MVDKIKCERKIANDSNEYLIALFKHMQSGGELTESVPRELYNRARTAWRNKDYSEFELWELGAIGFLASFGNKDFAGSYAKPNYRKTKNGIEYRDYYIESKNSLLKQVPLLKDIEFRCSDYHTLEEYAISNVVIYCDPPYANTTKYSNSGEFNHDEFWNTMRQWSDKGAIIYISELNAPDDFECIWKHEVNRCLDASNQQRAVEKLFRYKG